MPDVKRLLDAAVAVDHRAAADLLPFVYDELRKLAAVHMAVESPVVLRAPVRSRTGTGWKYARAWLREALG